MKRLLLPLVVALSLLAPQAQAGLTQQQIDSVGVQKKLGTGIPTDVSLTDATGAPARLGQYIGGLPTLMLFVDYTCRTSCGVSFEALLQRLQGLSLTAGRDYRLAVVGIDAKDGPADASAFREKHLPEGSRWRDRITFLSPDAPSIERLTRAVGYTYVYDEERDQFAHPSVALLVDSTGHLRRYVDPFMSRPLDVRLALVDAGDGATGTLADQILLCCYGWDPVTGVYTPLIDRILFAACMLTVLMVAGLLFFLSRRQKRLAPQEGQRV